MKTMLLSAIALFAAASAGSAQATNLVTNGGFESTTNGPGHMYYGYTDATGWNSNNGYNFIFAPGTADTSGSYTPEYNGYISFWGSNNGGPDVIPASSPDGGNFLGMDGAYQVEPMQQTLTGLTVGKKYNVGFYWAAAQQTGYNGATTEAFKVSLGAENYTTPIYSNPSHGFSGWMHQSFTFTAVNTSDVLSFLAIGTPDGLPPFSLLDGITASAVPEPASWAMLIAGFGLVGAAARRRAAVAA